MAPAAHPSIDQLYLAFQPYELRSWTDPCPCCHGEEEERLLHMAPLALLPARHLDVYTWSALNVWGGVEDFKHFLPRMLELYWPPEDTGVNLDLVLSKVMRAGWTSWPEQERTAVRAFLLELLRTGLASRRGFSASDLLCGLTNLGEDLTPFLAAWTALLGEDAPSEELARYIQFEAASLNDGTLWSAFYDQKHDAQVAQICAWLKSDELLAAVLERSPRTDELLSFLDWIM